MLAEFGMIH